MISAPPCHFDRAKPFYPQVMNYVCQLVGIVELTMRGIAGPRPLDELVESAIVRAGGIPQPETTILLRERFQKIIASPWRLRSDHKVN